MKGELIHEKNTCAFKRKNLRMNKLKEKEKNMNIKKRFSRCATVLAVAMTLGQTMIAPSQVLANGLESNSTEQATQESTTQATADSSQSVEAEIPTSTETTDSSNVSLPDTLTGDTQESWTVPYTQTNASGASAYTTDGNQIIFNQNFGLMTRDTGNSSGQLTQTYGAYSVSTPYITMTGENGGTVWCINPDKGFPVNIEYAQQVYNDEGIYNILYYAEKNGWNQANTDYVDVFVALNIYLGHSIGGINMNVPSVVNSPNVAFLLNKAQVKDAPTGNFDIKNKVQTANFDVASKLQVTDWYTPETDGNNVTYQIPTDLLPDGVSVELSNGTKYQAKTGSKTVNANEKFRLTAPASYTGKVKFDVDTNFKKRSALLFKPTSGNTQDVVKAGWLRDPLKVRGIEANFFARLGNAKFKKISEISNLPLEGVTYKVTEEGKDPYEMKTDANGELNFVDRLHGATIKVQEIANPIGYVLDSTEYTVTIEAAETVSKTLVNNVPRGKVKLMKQKTVLDVEATKAKGEPVYKKVPLAGAKFNVVAVTNIMLPDGKTVLTKAGEVVDIITTDSKGYAETMKELFVGKANVYRLVEVNVPEGYRAPSEDQTLFTIPYGNNTEKLIVYDLGTIDNELQTGKLKFLKQDSNDLFGLAGAKFTIEMTSGLYKGTYFTFTTKAEGNEFELPVGDWKLTEVKLPNNYEFDNQTPQTQYITIKDGNTVELKWNNKRIQPTIKSLFATVDGNKKIDPTIDNELKDVVKLTNAPTNVPVNVDAEFVVVDKNDQFLRSLGHVEEVKTFEEKTVEFDVLKELPKNTLKDGERLVATYIFTNEDKTIEYGREYNLSNKDQTVFAETPKAEIKTVFASVDGKKIINPTIDNQLKDIVNVKFTGAPLNTPVNVDTEFVVVDENDFFIRSLGHVEVEKTFEESDVEFEVLKDLPKNTLKDGERLVATHIFTNKEKTVEYGREYNLSNKDQTIVAKKPVVPTTPTKPTTPQKAVGTFPQTGEKESVASLLVGLMAIVAVIAFSVIKKRKESTVE